MTVVSSSAGCSAPAQRELFGLTVAADGLMTLTVPCHMCLSGVGVVTAGSGPHFAAVRCIRGHFQAWLPHPRPR